MKKLAFRRLALVHARPRQLPGAFLSVNDSDWPMARTRHQDTMRLRPAVVLICASFGFAPAIRAQAPASVPLTPTVGSPIAYQIGVPRGWAVQRSPHELTAARRPAVLTVVARDLVDRGKVDPRISESEARQHATRMIMGSDSALFSVMNLLNSPGVRPKEFRDVVHEIRTLGGERAGYMSGWTEDSGVPRARWERYLTVKDGIAYMLFFVVEASRYEAHRPLFARIVDSFVPAPSPGAVASPAPDQLLSGKAEGEVYGAFSFMRSRDPGTNQNRNRAILTSTDSTAKITWKCSGPALWLFFDPQQRFSGVRPLAILRFDAEKPDTTYLLMAPATPGHYLWSLWGQDRIHRGARSASRLVVQIAEGSMTIDYVFDVSQGRTVLRTLGCSGTPTLNRNSSALSNEMQIRWVGEWYASGLVLPQSLSAHPSAVVADRVSRVYYDADDSTAVRLLTSQPDRIHIYVSPRYAEAAGFSPASPPPSPAKRDSVPNQNTTQGAVPANPREGARTLRRLRGKDHPVAAGDPRSG